MKALNPVADEVQETLDGSIPVFIVQTESKPLR
jgi:hypothetical protein